MQNDGWWTDKVPFFPPGPAGSLQATYMKVSILEQLELIGFDVVTRTSSSSSEK